MIPKIPLLTKGICNFQVVYYGIYSLVRFMTGDDYTLIFKTYYCFEISYRPVYEIIFFSQVIFFMTNAFFLSNIFIRA
jgi:hypothetical protein